MNTKTIKSHYELTVLRRMALLYLTLWILRGLFWLCNIPLLGGAEWNELGLMALGALRFDTIGLACLFTPYVVLSLWPTGITTKRWWQAMLKAYYVAAASVGVVALNVSDIIYFRYTQKRINIEEWYYTGNSNTLLTSLQFVLDNWYLLIAAGLLIWMLVGCYGSTHRAVDRTRSVSGRVSLFVVGSLLCFVGVRGSAGKEGFQIRDTDAALYDKAGNKAQLILSNPYYLVASLYATHDPQPYAPYQALAKEPGNWHEREADSTDVSFKGRNVVIFILESFSAEHSGLLSGRMNETYTPMLDSLMQNGITFMNGYAGGVKSIEALPAVLGSIPSFRIPFTLLPNSTDWPQKQWPELLADEGYTTAFFCGSERGSMGFEEYARSAGVAKFYAMEDYVAKHGDRDFDGSWGIWDREWLQYMGEVVGHFDQPFFATVFTLDAHHPFRLPDNQKSEFKKGRTRVHPAVQYDDEAIRAFFDRFGQSEWFANTIFVFTADHVSSETFTPEARTALGNRHIVEFIYIPNSNMAQKIEKPVMQIDLMPTVMTLLQYDKPYFSFGRNVLDPACEGRVFGFSSRSMSFYNQ